VLQRLVESLDIVEWRLNESVNASERCGYSHDVDAAIPVRKHSIVGPYFVQADLIYHERLLLSRQQHMMSLRKPRLSIG
jgi:hypothetical protein